MYILNWASCYQVKELVWEMPLLASAPWRGHWSSGDHLQGELCSMEEALGSEWSMGPERSLACWVGESEDNQQNSTLPPAGRLLEFGLLFAQAEAVAHKQTSRGLLDFCSPAEQALVPPTCWPAKLGD